MQMTVFVFSTQKRTDGTAECKRGKETFPQRWTDMYEKKPRLKGLSGLEERVKFSHRNGGMCLCLLDPFRGSIHERRHNRLQFLKPQRHRSISPFSSFLFSFLFFSSFLFSWCVFSLYGVEIWIVFRPQCRTRL